MTVHISTEHYFDGWERTSTGKLSEKMAKKVDKLIKDKGQAIFYVNGCSFYLVPIFGDRYGFGSGSLDAVIESGDTLEDVKGKLYKTLDMFHCDVRYGGCESDKTEVERALKHLCWFEKPDKEKETVETFEDDKRLIEIISHLSAVDHKKCYEITLKDKEKEVISCLNTCRDRERAYEIYENYKTMETA